MTYKESIDLFKIQYSDQCFGRNVKEKNFSDLDVFTKLSIIQAELSNENRLYDKKGTFSVVSGTRTYTLSSIIPDCLNVINISYNNVNLEKISVDKMNEFQTESGTPGKYTIYGVGTDRKLMFDYTPDETVSYDVYYYARLKAQGTYATPTGIATGVYDETASGYGGSWYIPEEYHHLIIMGAIAKIFPDMYPVYMKSVSELLKRRQIVFSKTKGFLGI